MPCLWPQGNCYRPHCRGGLAGIPLWAMNGSVWTNTAKLLCPALYHFSPPHLAQNGTKDILVVRGSANHFATISPVFYRYRYTHTLTLSGWRVSWYAPQPRLAPQSPVWHNGEVLLKPRTRNTLHHLICRCQEKEQTRLLQDYLKYALLQSTHCK